MDKSAAIVVLLVAVAAPPNRFIPFHVVRKAAATAAGFCRMRPPAVLERLPPKPPFCCQGLPPPPPLLKDGAAVRGDEPNGGVLQTASSAMDQIFGLLGGMGIPSLSSLSSLERQWSPPPRPRPISSKSEM